MPGRSKSAFRKNFIISNIMINPISSFRAALCLAVSIFFVNIISDAKAQAKSFNSQFMSLPDTGWRLWLDKNADWKDEPAYLPGEESTSRPIPAAPTGGWSQLNDNNGIEVTLPTTVEQHFWGVNGLRPYKCEWTSSI
jgi:hypothetical protein